MSNGDKDATTASTSIFTKRNISKRQRMSSLKMQDPLEDEKVEIILVELYS